MQETQNTTQDLELTTMAGSKPGVGSTADRKRYLKKTGKSLWMKNKAKKSCPLSVEVSTRSSDGTSSYYETNVSKTTVSTTLLYAS